MFNLLLNSKLIKPSKNIQDQKKNTKNNELESFLFNLKFGNYLGNPYCSEYISSGSYGLVYKNNFPDKIQLIINKKKVYIDTIIKENIDDIDYNNFNYFQYKSFNYIESYNGDPKSASIISELLSELFMKSISPHFIIYFKSSICDKKYYDVFENINIKNIKIIPYGKKWYNEKTIYKSDNVSDLRRLTYLLDDMNLELNEDLYNHIIISCLHSLFVMQYNFDMIHFDLELRNIFIKKFDDNLYYDGKNLKNIKYFCYVLKYLGKETKLYTKNYGFIIKIGDPGLSSVKINNNIIICNTNIYDSIKKKVYKSYPYKKPNINYPEYIFLLRIFMLHFGINNLLKNMLDVIPGLNNTKMNNLNDGTIDINKYVNIEEILSYDIFKKYWKKPIDSNPNNTIYINYKL